MRFKIGQSIKNFRDRIRAAVSVKSQNVLFFIALFLIIFLAIMIRMTPLLRGPTLIKAFDPWVQYYNTKYISEHTMFEYFHWLDLKSWYPGGYARYNLRPGLPFTNVLIWNILNFVGIPISIYDVCYFFPAFMGGATCIAMYLLGKEILNKQMGLFAAFFLAFNTGHMQRTMAGFFDNETIGVFATLMTILYFLKAVRTGKITDSIIGGIFLGYLTLSWGGYSYVILVIPLVCGILVLTNKYNENVLIAYAGVQGTGLLLQSLFAQFNFNILLSDIEVGGIFLFTIVLIIFHMIYIKKKEHPKFYNNLIKGIVSILIPGSLIIAVVIWIEPDIIPFGFGRRLESVISPLIRDSMHIVASVAEHMPSAWGIFYHNTLIPLMLLPLGIYFCFKRLNAADMMLIILLLTLFYFTGSMIRIILLFAPAAALMGSYGLVSVLKIYGSFAGEKKRPSISRKRKRQLDRTLGNSEVFTVYFVIGFLCMAQVIHASSISIEQLSYSQIVSGGQLHDWEESLTWMKLNLEGTDVVVSWWDYGYWLTPIGNVTTVNDNATSNSSRIGLTGMAMMQTNEILSAKIFKMLKADYVLVYFGFLYTGLGGDEGKWPWMVRICNDNTDLYKSWGLEEDNWAEDSVFLESEYINGTSGKYEDKWFQSTLVKLMFFGEPTDPSTIQNPNANWLRWYYATQISGNPSTGAEPRKDDNGNLWKDHIPDNGLYDFKVFKPVYFSQSGMVKLFQLDYTALESTFLVKDANVFDNGDDDHAVFKVSNTGLRDLRIKNVQINNISYDFTMGKTTPTNNLKTGEEDVIWVDIDSQNYLVNDVVNITVEAEADALEGTTYLFTNSTSNFFVTAAKEESIRINRHNSKVVAHSADIDGAPDVYLEVENTGESTIKLDNFYVNNINNTMNVTTDDYIEGSPVLEPGQKAFIKSLQAPAAFYPFGMPFTSNYIGVSTINGIRDEALFSANLDYYKLSIVSEERIISPEIAATSYSTYRSNIPVNLTNTFGYTHENGTSEFNIKVKNTGETVIGLDSVILSNAITWDTIAEDKYEWDTIDHDLILDPNQENTIILRTLESNLLEINDEVVITVTGIGFNETTAASDLGYIHTIAKGPDIKFITEINSTKVSFITANETGVLTIKNTGNQSLQLDKLYLNGTDCVYSVDSNDVTFVTGDSDLDMQEVVTITFNIANLSINQSNDVMLNLTTNTKAFYNHTFEAVVNSYDHLIIVSNNNTDAFNLKFNVNGLGQFNVTIDSIYVNDTYIPLANFTFEKGISFEIGSPGGYITLSISMATLVTFGIPAPSGKKLKIFVRTKEGAENSVEIDVP